MNPDVNKKVLEFVERLNEIVVDFVNQQPEEIVALYEAHYGKSVSTDKVSAISTAIHLLQGARAQHLSKASDAQNPKQPVKRNVRWAASGAIKAAKAMTKPETEESKARLEVCKTCPEWTGKSCKVCGCFVNLKVRIPEEKCPKGKW